MGNDQYVVEETETRVLIGVEVVFNHGGRAALAEVAHAGGYETISDWIAARLSHVESIHGLEEVVDTIEDLLTLFRTELAVEILENAMSGYDFPGFSDVDTDAEFLAMAKSWAEANELNEVEAPMLLACAEAALAWDGRKARMIGDALLGSMHTDRCR